MGDKKGKMADKASEIAKNIWLAGVGAYGRAVDEAQGRLEKAGVETPKLFRDLVEAGTALEEEAKESFRHKSAELSGVEDRIRKVRENFTLQLPRRADEVSSLHAKLDQLAQKLDTLNAQLTQLGGSAKAPRKKAAGKAPTAKRKTAAKKTPAAAKKTPAAKKASAARKAPAAKRSKA